MKQMQKWLRVNKEGMIVGAIAGYMVYLYTVSQGYDFAALYHPQAVIDTLATSVMSAQELVHAKAVWVYMALGTIVGGLVDSVYKPRK